MKIPPIFLITLLFISTCLHSATLIDTEIRNGGFEMPNTFWTGSSYIDYPSDAVFSGTYSGSFSSITQSLSIDSSDGSILQFSFYARKSESADMVTLNFNYDGKSNSDYYHWSSRPTLSDEWQLFEGTFNFYEPWAGSRILQVRLDFRKSEVYLTGNLDNFVLQQIPEPHSLLLILSALVPMTLWLTRRCS